MASQVNGECFSSAQAQEQMNTQKWKVKGKGRPYSIAERTVKKADPDRPAVTLASLKRAATNFAAW